MPVSKQAKAKLLNSEEVKFLIGKPNTQTILHPRLADYDSFEELFRDKGNPVILLYVHELEPHPSGHWCLLSSPDDCSTTVEFWDSYGMAPDAMLKKYSKEWRRESGQAEPHVLRLMNEWMERNEPHGGQILFNEFQDQSKDPASAVCGRYVGFRGRHYRIPMQLYQDVFHEAARQLGMVPDDLITTVTEALLP